MLDQLKTKLWKKYKKTDHRGVFFSAFGANGVLLSSHGVIETDKSMEDLLDTLWQGLFASFQTQIKVLTADIVLDSYHETDPQKLLSLSPKTHGLFLTTQDGSQSAVLLPGTTGIADMKHGLYVLKQKYP